MHVLLTRPVYSSESLAIRLQKIGVQTNIEPMFTIKYLTSEYIDFNAFQAIVFTSHNAVLAFKESYTAPDIPVFTVGDKTAEIAHDIGFKEVYSADGNLKKLAGTIKNTLKPIHKPLLYLCGKHLSGNLPADMNKMGFKVKKHEIYDAIASKNISIKTKTLLKDKKINYIPFYSSRSALIFIKLIKKENLESELSTVCALCLSPAIKDIIGSLPWKEVMTAQNPTQYDLFKLIDVEVQGSSK